MKSVPASDSSLLVVFGNTISPVLHERVMALFHALQVRLDPRIRNLHPGYASLLVDFDPLRLTHDELTAIVRATREHKRHSRCIEWACGYHSSLL